MTARNRKTQAGDQIARPRRCRVCGCTDDRACIDAATGEACHWAEPGLCSACAMPRAEIRRRARAALPDLARALRGGKPRNRYNRFGLELMASHIHDGSGSEPVAYLELDRAIGLRLVARLEKLLGDGRARRGGKPGRRRAKR